MAAVPSRLLLILVALPALAFARSEGGSDAGHSGGGGTFLRCEAAVSKQVFYSFWDLGAKCPSQPGTIGDRIVLDPHEVRDGGTWVDAHLLRSYQFLRKRVRQWKRWAPHFSELLGRDCDMRFFMTPYSIQSVAEIQVAPGSGDVTVVPGAYYDYDSGVLYVDIKIWNQASLESQAAMILHEMLRSIQVRYQLKNHQIQYVVRRVIGEEPSWSREEMFRYDWMTCKLFNDDLFAPSRALPLPLEVDSPGPPPAVLAARALKAGFLGTKPVSMNPHTNGRFGVEERKPSPNREMENLGSCLDDDPDEDY